VRTTPRSITSGGRTVSMTSDSTLTQLYFGLQLGVMGRF
jgi:hypothetical protein